MLTILRLIVIAIAGFFINGYYGSVMSSGMAMVISILIIGGLLLTMLMGSTNMKIIFQGGLTIVIWPAGVYVTSWLMNFIGHPISGMQAIAAAPMVAANASLLAYSMSANRDRARDLATISIGFISLYTMMRMIAIGDASAIPVASASVAFSSLVIYQMLVLPPHQQNAVVLMIGFAVMGTIFSAIAVVL
jgi:hypothetical protein